MRPQSKVFSHFRVVLDNNKEKFVCRYCDAIYSNKNATKFARHLTKCNKCPLIIKNDFDKVRPKDFNVENIENVAPLSENNMNITPIIDNNEVHCIISRAIFVTGQPLSMLEHPLWREAFKVLRPDYELPTRKCLSTSLLDEEYTRLKTDIIEKIHQASVLHLAVDGWSNLRNDAILNIIIYAPKPYFYTFLDTKKNRHTSEYLAEQVSKVIDELGANKFLTIITDNAANMIKCSRILSNRYENLMWFGCIAHTLHLIIGDLLKVRSIKSIFTFVVSVVKCIEHSHLLSAEYRKLALEKSIKVSLLLPVKTRWGSYANSLNNFMQLKIVLQLMVVNTENIEMQKFKTMLLDENTWTNINKHFDIIKSVVNWIIKLEGDYGTIHLVHQALSEIGRVLHSTTSEEVLEDQCESIRRKFIERKNNSLKPAHFAAAILDPQNQGVNLTTVENLDGCQFILNQSQCDGYTGVNIMEELAEYKSRINRYGRELVWSSNSATSTSPIMWWNLFFPCTNLGKTALNFLSIPSTSASVERSFSTFSNIHTFKRNKLTTERAGKLCFIAHNWKLLNPNIQLRREDSIGSNTEDSLIEEYVEEVEFDVVDMPEDETYHANSPIILDEDPLSADLYN